MSVTCTLGGLDISRYLLGFPKETVTKRSAGGTFADEPMQIELADSFNAFTGAQSILSGNTVEEEDLKVCDDSGLYIDAYVVSGRSEGALYILTCRSDLSRNFDALVVQTIAATTPPAAIAAALSAFGIDYDEASFTRAAALCSLAGMSISVYVLAQDGVRLIDHVNTLAEMCALDVWRYRGTVYCGMYEAPGDGERRTLTAADMIDYPKQSFVERFYTAYSVDYIGSGGLPAQGGYLIKDRTWSYDANAGKNYRLNTISGAHAAGAFRLLQEGKQRKTLAFPVNLRKRDLDYGEIYRVSFSDMGIDALPMRITAIERDERIASLSLVEVIE